MVLAHVVYHVQFKLPYFNEDVVEYNQKSQNDQRDGAPSLWVRQQNLGYLAWEKNIKEHD